MADYNAGSASIRIGVDMRGFDRDLRTELEARDVELKVRVTPDLKSIEKLQGELDTVGKSLHVDAQLRADTKEASAQLEAWRKEESAKGITVPVKTDSKGARAAAESAKKDLEKAFKDVGEAGMLNIRIGGIAGLAGAATSLLSVADGAAKAAGSLGLIPAAAAAAGIALAGLKIGMSGVGDAFQAYAAETKSATDIANAHADAVHGVEVAQRSSVQATKDLDLAYRDASRSIRDMNLDLQEQKLSTEDAALSVQEAAQRLFEVQHDPTADATQRARAQLDYQEAIARLQGQQNKTRDLAEDTKKANQQGIDGSQKVIDATNRVADAVYALDKAQRTLNQGSGQERGLAQTLAKLSPDARQFVADVRSIAPAWTDLRNAAQDSLFAGIGDQVQQLADAQLPNLKTGLVGVNAALNTGIKATLIELATRQNQLDFRAFLGNTTQGLENLSRGAAPATDAITKLITVGSSEFPKLGSALADAAQRFDDLIQRTSQDGSLKKWIDDGLRSAHEIVQTIENIGSAVASVARAAASGGTGLEALDNTTKHIAAFLKAPAEQNELQSLFADARQEAEKWKPILADLPQLLAGVTAGAKGWSDVTMPFLKAAADLLSAHPALVRAAVTAYLGFKTVSPILDVVKAGIGGLQSAAEAAAGKVKGLKTAAAEAGGEEGAGKLGGALGAVSTLIGGTLGGPWGLAITAGTLALGALATAHQNAAAAADQQRQALDNLGQTLDQQTGRATEATLRQTAEFLQKGGYLDQAEKAGIDTNTLVRAASGVDPNAKKLLNQQLQGRILDSGTTHSDLNSVAAETGLSPDVIVAALGGDQSAIAQFNKAKNDAETTASASGLTLRIDDLSELKKSFDAAGQSAITLDGQLNNINSTLSQRGDKFRQIQQATEGTFSLTEKGAAAFKDLGLAIDSVPDAKTVVVKAATEEQIAKLKELGDTVQTMKDGTVKVNLDDKAARTEIQQITTGSYGINVNVNLQKGPQNLSDLLLAPPETPSDTGQFGAFGTLLGAHKTGGLLPMAGKGRDGILGVAAKSGTPISWLDGGEFVVNRDESKEYAPELAAINAGTFPHHEDGGSLDDPDQNPDPNSDPGSPVPNASTVTPQQVVNPQAPLPARMTDAQIAIESAKAQVDQANTSRNAVYANQASTDADKHSADIKYNQAQNALSSAQQQNNQSLLSVQGIATQGAGILANGLLSAFGLQDSILSSSNTYNKDANELYNQFGPGTATGYTGQNLPTTTTTVDTTGTGTTTIPTTGQVTGASNLIGGSPTTNLGTINVNATGSPAATASTGSFSGDVERWRPMAGQAMTMAGFNPANPAQLNAMMSQIGSESGGDPNAINLTDSNAAAGHPSQGLLQTIPSTFETYRSPQLVDSITDPLANMVAALRYYRSTYGSDLTTQWGHGHGYDDGGIARGIGLLGKGTIEPERVLSPHQTRVFDSTLPLLEQINTATGWGARSIGFDTGSAVGRPDSATTVRDHSVNYHAPITVMNPEELVRAQDRWTEQQSMAALGAY